MRFGLGCWCLGSAQATAARLVSRSKSNSNCAQQSKHRQNVK